MGPLQAKPILWREAPDPKELDNWLVVGADGQF